MDCFLHLLSTFVSSSVFICQLYSDVYVSSKANIILTNVYLKEVTNFEVIFLQLKHIDHLI